MTHGRSVRRRLAALGIGMCLLLGGLAGCGEKELPHTAGSEAGQSAGQESTAGQSAGQGSTAGQSAGQGSTAGQPGQQEGAAENGAEAETAREAVEVRIGSLKGPTSMGILFLQDKANRGETTDRYSFQMATGADELLPLMVKGELDIALVPANVAAVLYQKTAGGVCVIDVNTLGVLYVVTGSDEVSEISDLMGKTIYLTGKGTTPEAALRYVLDANGLTEADYTLEFKSEATEVAAVLAEDPEAIGVLPQPFVTAAQMQNGALKAALDLNGEWMRVENNLRAGSGNGMVTGVTIVRRSFLEEHPEAVETFLEEHADSAQAINEDAAAGAVLAVEAGIVAKESIAREAIPKCNIVCVTGEEMKADLSAYLEVLMDFQPELTGGGLPGEDFYYLP